MNKTISEKKADPVPSKKLLMVVVILLSAATCGITSAKAAAAEGWEAPVLLSDGTLMKAPWYIMVDGKKAALVDSRETAEQVIQNIVTSCGHEGAEVLDVERRNDNEKNGPGAWRRSSGCDDGSRGREKTTGNP